MKQFIITVALLFPMFIIGQTQDKNYVKATIYQQPVDEGQEDNLDASQKIESISYVDGLGRPIQSIAVGAGGEGQNIISYVEYDGLGRTPKQYLPYATQTEATNLLDFVDQEALKIAIGAFYATPKYEDTQNPYSEMVYENSPLNRVLKQGAPGNSWAVGQDDADHTIKFEYANNQVNEVRYFDVIFSGSNTQAPSLSLSGYYSSRELYKSVVKDENWTPTSGNNHTTEEFTNKSGQVLLKRTYDNNSAHDTYYVYDDYGNLTFVLSPEASDQIVDVNDDLITNYQDILDKLGYQYKYDYRNRLIEKKIPAKGWEYIVYNLLDQPVLTQDARLRESNQWLFTKYDALQRVVYTGFITNGGSRQALQNYANNTELYPSVFEHRVDNQNSIADTPIYYSRQSFPTSTISKILTINYYDTYVDMAGLNLPDIVYGQNVTNSTQGLPTVSKVRILDTDHWITTVTGYDEKARPIFGRSVNTYLDTEDTSESLLDFTGKVLESRTTHQKTSHQEIVIKDYFTYDHQNRLLSHKQKINSEPLQLIASNTYDELGQLISKDVGGETTFDGYTDMIKISIDAENNLTKVPDSDTDFGWDAKLKTKGEITGNGGISFVTPHDAFRYYRVGLINTNYNNEDDRYYDYGIYIKAGDGDNDGFSDVNIIIGSISPITTYVGQYVAGDTFKVERNGSQIQFKKNNATFYTVSVDPDAAFVGKTNLYSPNTKVNDLTLYGDYIDKKLQKVDYQYNVRGWLTDINPTDSQERGTDLFQFKINYDAPIEGNAGLPDRAVPLYNGNISQTTWQSANVDRDKHTYGYKYDALNRIKVAYNYKGTSLEGSNNYGVRGITYDLNGNIFSLIRAGKHFNLDSPLNMDDLSYSYDGNQLLNVTDASISGIKKKGFYDGNTSAILDDYEYDINGNMIIDRNKGITEITYNHLNLPVTVKIYTNNDPEDNPQRGTITYIYDATGVKLEKKVENDILGGMVITKYAGGYIYEQANGPEKLMMFPHPEGYVEAVYATEKSTSKDSKETKQLTNSDYQYAFNYTDHLGNVRLTYSDSNGDGAIESETEIISEKHYYPFGLQQQGYNNTVSSNVNSVANRFGYGGKELQEGLGLGMYDFGARLQDPSLGRWFVVDALADQPEQIDKSPYAYGWNNPIFYTDPDGNCPECVFALFAQGLKDTQQALLGAARAVGEASDALMSRSWQGRADTIRAEMANPSPPDDRTAFVQLAQPILDATLKPVVEGAAAFVQGDFEGVGYNGTKVAANVAVSRGIPGLKGAKGTKGAGGTTTTLYRAVDDFELSDISNKGLRVNPDGSGYQSGKLFAQSAEDAASQAKSQSRWDGTARTTLEVKVSNSVMQTSSEIPMDMGIMRYPTIEIPANQLSNINNILPLQSSAIPQIR